ncbi:LuxR C-terminal-related transcriptional regulator, partial [Kitasatospora sp. NPDC056181]|uniref:LuxR C-terminal-related transcriptional regulator n=1 Tax=Kitasatospora sp. NPDC056181 TaxID=3345737 RepID=UPI0035DAB044
MSTPPTAERPTGAPTTDGPAPHGRSSEKGRAGRGRAAKNTKATRAKAVGGPTTGPTAARTAGPSAGQEEAARLLRQLTPREAEALAHLAAGRNLAETAAALGVAPATARSYQHRAMRKLGTRTRGEIDAFAALLSPAQTAPAAGRTAPGTTAGGRTAAAGRAAGPARSG